MRYIWNPYTSIATILVATAAFFFGSRWLGAIMLVTAVLALYEWWSYPRRAGR